MDPIARYLHALADPESLIDASALAALERRIAKSTDPVERVKLRAQLARARRVDLDQLAADFVAALPKWTEAQGMSASDAREAFAAEGVPKDVLDRALGGGAKPARAAAPKKKRRPRVPREAIESAIPAKGEVFTTADLVRETGASYAGVRNIVGEWLEAGRLKEHGPAPDHAGRGKAPTLYERKR